MNALQARMVARRPFRRTAPWLAALLVACATLGSLVFAPAASAAEEGQITGHVTSAATKAAIAGIQVCAYQTAETEYEYFEYSSEFLERCQTTKAGGEYTIAGLAPGTYTVEFKPPLDSSLNYLTQYYKGKTRYSEAQPVTVTGGGVTSGIDAALAGGGQVSGTVTDASSKSAIAGISVCASDRSAIYGSRCALTNASGEYTLTGLGTSQYTVEFAPPEESSLNYLRQYYNGKAVYGEAQPVAVTVGSTTSAIDAALQGGGQIAGTVTNAASKAAISGISVCGYEKAGEGLGRCTTTNGSGEYTLAGLAAAEYVVSFAATEKSGLNFVTQYYNGKTVYGEATGVTVTKGATTSGIDAALTAGGSITGKVTNVSSKAAIKGITVCAYPSSAGTEGCAVTNASGEYTIPGLLTDSYTVEFAAPYYSGSLNYLTQYYNGKSNYEEATPVSVTTGSATPGIDAALQEGGRITGKLTDFSTKAALQGVVVCAYPASSEYAERCAITDASGEYRIGHLLTGSYRVGFSPPNQGGNRSYLTQYYNGKATLAEAEAISVTAGSVSSGINAALHEGGKVTGTVTSATTKAPIEAAEVCARTSSGEYTGQCGFTNASGEYVIVGLASGEYKVEFVTVYNSGSVSYVAQYYKAKATLSEADPVSVTAGATTPAINAALAEGAKITGTVTNLASKAAIEGIEVCARTSAGSYAGCAFTNAAGVYQVEGLPSGEYKVEFAGAYYSVDQNYIVQYYNGKATFSEGELVSATAGSTTSGINAALQEGAKITGTVTNVATKAAVQGIYVCARLASTGGYVGSCVLTNTAGEYALVGLPSGEYKVEFEGYSTGAGYLTQFYNGKGTLAEATPLSVTVGTTTSGINAALQEAAKVTGTVTNASTKAAVQGIEVCARLASTGAYTGSCQLTNAKGEYAVTGLPSGEYKIEFDAFSSSANYLTQYYNGKSSLEAANAVSATAGSTTSGIDAALQEGGKIAGTVTNALTKAAVNGLEVCASGTTTQCANTNASGEYTIQRLPTGSYTVTFYGNSGGLNLITQYYNGKAASGEANPVSVTAPSTTSGINAAMSEGGKISGLVTSATTKAGIEGIEVCAYEHVGSSSGCASTGAGGAYTIAGLTDGEYTVEFYGNGTTYSTQYYNGKASFSEGNLVTVTVGGTTTGINAAMGLAGTVTGTVTDASTKAAIEGIEVCARRHSGEYVGACATTGAGGKYTISGLSVGEYVVEFLPGSSSTLDYAPQYYNGHASFSEANLVSVTSGGTASEINAALLPGGEISGKVTDAATKAALSGAKVCASETANEFAARCATTNGSGEYTITALPRGQYRVQFSLTSGEYATQYYNGSSTFGEAQIVAVTGGIDVEGISAAMHPGGQIAGVVTSSATKAAISGIQVCAGELCATTNTSGEYTVAGLSPGEYTVVFRGAGLDYITQYYNEKSSSSEANKVTVTAHHTTPAINAPMHEGGQIGGVATDASSKAAIAGIYVCASGGATSECSTTGPSGEYTISGLPTGSYTVSFTGNGHNYVTQYYNGKSSSSEATPVAVTVGSKASGISAAMVGGAQVTGTVTSAASKAAIGHVNVCAQKHGGGVIGCSKTNLAGEYTIAGLPTGEYTVSFEAGALGYITQYYNGKATAGEANTVTLKAGTVTSAIDAALEEGGEIGGKVTDAATKAAIPSIQVYVYNSSGGFATAAATRPNGEFLATGLPAGEYKVEYFSTTGAYETQYYNGKGSLEGANQVSVTAGGHLTPGINAALAAVSSSPAPRVTSVLPGRGTEAGGTSVTISGANLSGATAVKFGAVAAKSFTVESTNIIKATAPAGHGTLDVRVTTPEGTSAVTEADRYAYRTPEQIEEEEAAAEALTGVPTVTGVMPDAVLTSGGTVTLSGQNYVGVKSVTFGEEPAVKYEVNSPTKITAVVPDVKIRKECQVKVVTETGTSKTRPDNALECVPPGSAPTVTKVSPNKGPDGGGQQITVTGTGFLGVTGVLVGGQRATQVKAAPSETSLTAVIPSHAEGSADVTVATPSGTSAINSKDRFKYGKPATPTVTSLAPAAGLLAGGTEITIGGTNFVSGMTFLFGKISVPSSACITTSCRVSSPAATKAGTVDVLAVVGKSKSKKASADHYTYE